MIKIMHLMKVIFNFFHNNTINYKIICNINDYDRNYKSISNSNSKNKDNLNKFSG